MVARVFRLLMMTTSTFLHYEVLSHLNERLLGINWISRRAKVLVVVLVAILSHAAHILLYASAYYLLRDGFQTGSRGGQFQAMFSTFFYLSAETYTSLELGDIFPMGQLRVMVGFETLTGLLMVSWTASFTYLEMSRYWRD